MDEEIERLVVSVRADTRGFAGDVAAMRGELEGPFASAMDRAGATLERSLGRAIASGKFGFDDLRRVAMSVLSEIASASIHNGLQSLGGQGGSGGVLASLGNILVNALGSPGRATGGPVSPGRPFVVGERGPELFVPTTAGRIENGGSRAAPNVRLTINISDNGRGSAPETLQRSSRQVARAVRQALMRGE